MAERLALQTEDANATKFEPPEVGAGSALTDKGPEDNVATTTVPCAEQPPEAVATITAVVAEAGPIVEIGAAIKMVRYSLRR